MRRADKIISLVLLGFLAFAYYWSLGFPDRVARYPRAVIIICGFMALVILAKAVLEERQGGGEDKKGKEGFTPEQKYRLFVTGIAAILYIILIPIVGYFASTALFMFALMMALDPSKKVLYLIVVSGATLALYGVFGVLLRIWVPRGFLF